MNDFIPYHRQNLCGYIHMRDVAGSIYVGYVQQVKNNDERNNFCYSHIDTHINVKLFILLTDNVLINRVTYE